MLRVFTLLVACSLGSVCQPPTCVISGMVSDLFGDPLAGASVEVLSESHRVVKAVRTDVAGAYRIVDVPAGRLRLVFNLQGFQQETAHVQLKDGETLYLHIGLQPGAFTDLPAIEVRGSVQDVAKKPMRSIRVSIAAYLNPRLQTEALTDSAGRYRAFLHTPGVYIISVRSRKMVETLLIVAPAPAITSKPPIRADFVISRAK